MRSGARTAGHVEDQELFRVDVGLAQPPPPAPRRDRREDGEMTVGERGSPVHPEKEAALHTREVRVTVCCADALVILLFRYRQCATKWLI